VLREVNLTITPAIIIILIIAQIISLIHYVEKTNHYITNFLESIRYSEFSRTFQVDGLGSSYDEMKRSFNSVMKDFQKIRLEKEEHQLYLKNVIQHIGMGLIAYQPDGKVELLNNSAKKIFKIHHLKNIEQLKDYNENLAKTLFQIKSGENALLKVQDDNELLQLSIYAKEFKISTRSVMLVSIQNIQYELEKQEYDAWQKLIRVLTHEIMNSITPIASLAATVNDILNEFDTTDNIPQEVSDDTLIDIQDAVRTINKRSDGLIHFVESYRNLTKIPTPEYSLFSIKQLFDTIEELMEKELKEKNLHLEISVEPATLELYADEKLIEQILINLMKNSIESLENKKDGTIELKAFLAEQGKILLQVKDNGVGILEDVVDKIFVPFFTTKKGGSGIGLSLSRQIMRLHGGTISVQSVPDKETCFSLRF